QDHVDRASLRLADVPGVQVLRAGEDVEAVEVDLVDGQLGQQVGDGLDVDAELLRTAAEAHAGGAYREVGVHPQSHPGLDAEGLADLAQSGEFAGRLQLDQHPGGDRPGEFVGRLARPGEADPGGRHRGVQRVPQLAGGGHVEAVDQAAQVVQQRGHRVG